MKAILLGRRKANERISTSELVVGLKKLLSRYLGQIKHVIIHRDGRFLEGELDDFIIVLNNVGISKVSLVAVKKSNHTAITAAEEGTKLRLSGERYLLLTNTQSELARPLEIELMHSDKLTLDEIVSQVFWLSRVFLNNVQHPSTIPATTHWANGIACTGKVTPLSGW